MEIRQGATAAEYAVVLALIITVAMLAIKDLGSKISNTYKPVANALPGDGGGSGGGSGGASAGLDGGLPQGVLPEQAQSPGRFWSSYLGVDMWLPALIALVVGMPFVFLRERARKKGAASG
jgi:Flp pilus assembly pilin Flp